jgi:hypothetical protein
MDPIPMVTTWSGTSPPPNAGPVGFAGEAGQRLDARAGRERRRGLVEPQVAIPPNPQELQVDSTGARISRSYFSHERRQIVTLRRGQVDAPAVDIHAAENALP